MTSTILRSTAAAIAFAGALALATPSMAAMMNFKTSLSGKSEVPPNTLAATGSVTATYDSDSKKLTWQGSYGLSWSADVACATRFADGRRVWTGGSVLLETLAAPKAIICKITYPKPLTQKEIKALKRKYPGITIDEFHDEQEYLVDRRYLDVVKVVRRYAQTFPE